MFHAMTASDYNALKDYPTLIYGLAPSPFGQAAVAWWPDAKKGNDKICYFGLKSGDLKVIHALQRLFPRNDLHRDDQRVVEFVDRYFKSPDAVAKKTPVIMKGTPFFLEVWKTLHATKPGHTMSYGELAALCDRPRASRAVGSAMSSNPVALLVPCHRVLASTGGMGGYAYGLETKKRLLANEKA